MRARSWSAGSVETVQMRDSTAVVAWLEEPSKDDAVLVGAKGCQPVGADTPGHPVLPGFVVTAQAFLRVAALVTDGGGMT